MGPKKGNNPKAVAAKEKKADAKEREEAQKLKQSEDEQWAAAGEGAKSKAQAKKDEQAKQREEANAKKAEAKRLAAEEEAAVTAKKPAKAKVSAPKVTSHQLQLEREARQRETQKEQEQRKREQKREVAEDSYEQLIGTPNMNRAEGDGIEARSVGAALSALDLGGDAEEDRHPERRAKAAFEKYQETKLQELKEEKPGLRQSQYKDMIWKAWQKAPENPLVKAQLQQ